MFNEAFNTSKKNEYYFLSLIFLCFHLELWKLIYIFQNILLYNFKFKWILRKIIINKYFVRIIGYKIFFSKFSLPLCGLTLIPLFWSGSVADCPSYYLAYPNEGVKKQIYHLVQRDSCSEFISHVIALSWQLQKTGTQFITLDFQPFVYHLQTSAGLKD